MFTKNVTKTCRSTLSPQEIKKKLSKKNNVTNEKGVQNQKYKEYETLRMSSDSFIFGKNTLRLEAFAKCAITISLPLSAGQGVAALIYWERHGLRHRRWAILILRY